MAFMKRTLETAYTKEQNKENQKTMKRSKIKPEKKKKRAELDTVFESLIDIKDSLKPITWKSDYQHQEYLPDLMQSQSLCEEESEGEHTVQILPIDDKKVTKKKKKKKKKTRYAPILMAITPTNQELERGRFLKSRNSYNPMFMYKYPAKKNILERMSTPSCKLLPLALNIMKFAMERYGSYEEYEAKFGGRKLYGSDIVEACERYLKKEGMLDEVNIQICKDLVPKACMTRKKGRPTLQIRYNGVRENWIEGLLRHEIGTHYVRSSNNQLQPWKSWKVKKELGLKAPNATEEGLASIHTVLYRREPSIWRAALLYYTAYYAKELSFSDLFKDLEKFVNDPEERWNYCLRAKRGQSDTSEPGCFSKDQVYLTGILDILKYRNEIDFPLLVRLGRVNYLDIDKLKNDANLENARIPSFMCDMDLYRERLDYILNMNGLTDEDLMCV